MTVHIPLVQSCDSRKRVLETNVVPLVMADDEEETQ